jgi:hypothetical protein
MCRAVPRSALFFALAALLLGCEPKLVVGTWSGCEGSEDPNLAAGAGGQGRVVDAIASPWSTGFESGFCDYTRPSGYCYAAELAGYETVTSPVRGGRFAAAFSVNADGTMAGHQTRCVRQGTLPGAAFYSAYFFIPEAPSATNTWNLIHFQGGDGGPPYHGLWDVSLAIQDDGTLRVFVFDFLRALRLTTDGAAIPVGSSFQLEEYWQRAADETGEFAVYQEGELALGLVDIITDDTSVGQWY